MTKLKINFIALVLLLFFRAAFLSVATGEEAGKNEKINLVIVFPGGPGDNKEIQRAIEKLDETIAAAAGFAAEQLRVEYFNDGDKALAHLRKNPDSFVMGSLGFFLSNRDRLQLLPLARIEQAGGRNEHYYLIVKKGEYKTAADLKGKTVSGNTLYESGAFLSKIVFDGRFDAASHFRLEPTSRPLRAIRRLLKGETDAVLLDESQYRSLERLPLFQEIGVVYTSPRLPELGLMMTDTPRSRSRKDRLLSAFTGLNRTEEGAEVLSGFGLEGFEEVAPETFDGVIKKFEAQ